MTADATMGITDTPTIMPDRPRPILIGDPDHPDTPRAAPAAINTPAPQAKPADEKPAAAKFNKE